MQQPMASRSEQPSNPVKYHYADTFWCIYITSVVSACIAELGMFKNSILLPVFSNLITISFTATYPLDLTKTRLQIQGEALNANINNVKVGRRLLK